MVLLAALVYTVIQQSQSAIQSGLLDAREVSRVLAAKDPMANIAIKERQFLDELESYVSNNRSMPDEEAARKWLELIDEAHAVPRRPRVDISGYQREPLGSFLTVVEVLPRPEVWPSIVNIVSKRPPSRQRTVIQLLFARLQGDEAAVKQLTGELSKKRELNLATNTAIQIQQSQAVRMGDLMQQIQILESADPTSPIRWGAEIPDLVSLIGPERAKPILLKLLVGRDFNISISGKATKKLAQQIALKHFDQIRSVPRFLVEGIEDAEFARTIVAHYGAKAFSGRDSNDSLFGVYLADLLLHGQIDKATALIRNESDKILLSTRNDDSIPIDTMQKLYRPICSLMERAKGKDLWDIYVAAARASGHAVEAIKRLHQVLDDPSTEKSMRSRLLANAVTLEAGVGDFRSVFRDFQAAKKIDPSTNLISMAAEGASGFEPDLRYLTVCMLAGKGDEIQKDITAETKSDLAARDGVLIEALLALKDYRTLEDLVGRQLRRDFAVASTGFEDDYAYLLCRLYYLANRPKDVLEVIEKFPFSGGADLADILPWSSDIEYDSNGAKPPIGFYAAWAYAKTGRNEMAMKVLKGLLASTDDSDEAFELLNSLAGPAELTLYDAIHKCDPMEPKPLVWKAALLSKLGKLAEAEETVRQAIQMDPSDSRSGPDHRFKSFEVLSSILRKKGDLAGARDYEHRVEAVRLAEKGDRFKAAGFFPYATYFYGMSVQLSPTDYSTEQSWAGCLELEGRAAEAVNHWKKAYRLLPSAFGLSSYFIEPIVGGNIFRDRRLAEIGLPILEAMPKTAGRLYLSGTMAGVLSEPRKEVSYLKEAVKLDPGLGIAWRDLANLGKLGFLDRAETEAAAVNEFRLDQARLAHAMSWNFELISDLRPIYRAIEAGIDSGLPSPLPLLPLQPSGSPGKYIGITPWNLFPPRRKIPAGKSLTGVSDVREIINQYGDWPFQFGGD